MKNNILKVLALSGAVVGCSVVAIANGANLNNSTGISDYGCDLLNTTGDRLELRKLASEGEINCSKTYVQYAEYDSAYYLRCATAIKGEAIDSLTYTRGELVGEDSTKIASKEINVSTVYKYLISDGNQAYYDGTEIVYEETEETKQYYWACYTVRFETKNFYASDFSVSFNVNGEAIDTGRMVNLTTLVSGNDASYSQLVTRYDNEYHYYACVAEGFEHLEKKEAHDIVDKIMVEPTLESSGLTEGVECSECGYTTQKVLPALSEKDYDVTSVRKVVSGTVVETSTFVLKDKTIGDYTFTAVTNEFTNYITIGTHYYSVEEFNAKYPNLVASVADKNLTILVKDGTSTTIDGVDGEVNLLNFNTVTITGNGVLDIKMTSTKNSSGTTVYYDCIVGMSLIVDEGVTLNLTGASNLNKSGIKVYQDLVINGIINISKFGYGQAINLENDHKEILTVTIAENAEYNINNVKFGIYAWNQAYPKRPSINNYGKLSITNASSHGIFLDGATASFYGRGNSETYISCVGNAIGAFNGLYIGDGEKGAIQNNAKFTAISSGDNVIRSKSNQGGSILVVFNSSNTIHIESTTGSNNKSGIEIAYQNIMTLFQISCADMTIKGCNKAIGTWKDQKIKATYNYEAPNAKLKVVNCKTISYSNGATNGVFDCFNADTVVVS